MTRSLNSSELRVATGTAFQRVAALVAAALVAVAVVLKVVAPMARGMGMVVVVTVTVEMVRVTLPGEEEAPERAGVEEVG